MFAGDLEKAGFVELHKKELIRQALSETNIFAAAHHGRENVCCDQLKLLLKNEFYVVISDKSFHGDILHIEGRSEDFYIKCDVAHRHSFLYVDSVLTLRLSWSAIPIKGRQ